MPAEAVFNQTGYLPRAEKIATVRIPTVPAQSAEKEFKLFAGGDLALQPLFRGPLSPPMTDSASGDSVMLADFSSFTAPGSYRIEIGVKRSEAFPIGAQVYLDPLRMAVRAFYGQRCGCEVDLGGGYSHSACHLAGAFHSSSGRQGAQANHGGWHDAGDYGRYVVNSGITTGTLLWAWELYPKALRNLDLMLPETKYSTGGKLPDYLTEVRWNLEWMLAMQADDGGVWHKQTSEQFCGFIMPQRDETVSYIIGTGSAPYKSTCATADLAAVMAIAARCYGEFDPAFSTRCLAAAGRAWRWAIAHPNIRFTNPPGIGTGDYGDARCNDEILWASAELWRTTGESRYEQALLNESAHTPPETAIASDGSSAPGWANVAPMAYWTYALATAEVDRKPQAQLLARIQKQTALAADALLARQAASGYGNTMAHRDYGWGSNSNAANQSLLLLIANRFSPDKHTNEAALGNLHYLLGRNCFGISWVTQVGVNAFQHPHHRPSAADNIAAPWPGLLSGGPNASPADPAAQTLPALPPMRMWLDDERAYSLNEVAINWNAPLVFLLAAANSAS